MLDDAVRLHGLTQETAIAVLEMTEAGRVTVSTDSLAVLVASLWNSYRINAPTGALEAATMAGTIARLEDEVLKDLLLGWDGLIEDLLEEEVDGGANAQRFMRELVAARGGAHSIASAYRASVSGEVVGEQRNDIPGSRHTMDWDALIVDPTFESELLLLLMYAQFSEQEAVAFRDHLTRAIRRLELVLAEAVV